MRALAVDFGTSNTVAALAVDGRPPRLVTVDSSPLVPSAAYLTDDGTLAVGRDAIRQSRLDPSRFEPNPKRRVDEGEILLGSAAVPVRSVVAAVLARIGAEVRRQLGGTVDEVRLTHPARWGARRRAVLAAAAREAGLLRADAEPILVAEPVALSPPAPRPRSVEEKIVLFGGITAGLSAGRLIGYLPAMIGAGVAGTVLAPVSMGLGVVLTAWMVHSRQHVADKNHLRQWLNDVLGEAKAVLDAELVNQFTDAEHALTIALDPAVVRRSERLDAEIREIDSALRLDAQQKEQLRRDLASRRATVGQVVAKVDAALDAVRTTRIHSRDAP